MSGYDKYVLILCFTVFAFLTAFFALLIAYIVRLTLKAVRSGTEDRQIVKERLNALKRKKNVGFLIAEKIVSGVLFIVAVGVFAFSLAAKFNENTPVKSVPALKVVKSDSMSFKYEKNEYLVKYNLNDQLQRFDLITVSALPGEDELKLYDVVVYESSGILLVHRIVDITEADETHGDRYFLLQGDANEYPDRFPVKYSQMKGIYTGKRMPYIGSFFIFISSPAGYLCVLLIVFTAFMYPLIEKKINKEKKARLALIIKKARAVLNKKAAPKNIK